MKMTVETVCSRKVTLREDVLSSYEKRYGMGVPEERQRTRARRTTLAEDSARQGLRQDSLIRWQGGIKEEIRLRWPCYRKNFMTGKSIARFGGRTGAQGGGWVEEVERAPTRCARKERAFRRKTFLALTEFR